MDYQAPFRELKVVELASVLAGPLVGTFFAELGAEVLKIENRKTGGDITRQWKLPSEPADNPFSAYYLSANQGKKSVLMDLDSENERNEIHRILSGTDILILNFKAGDASRFGLGWNELSVQHPRLICLEINGYGANDPRPAFDLALQAETGFMSMNGTRESGPLKMPVAMIDLLAAHQAKEGILTALYCREKTGAGALVTVSLLDSALSSLANQGTNFLVVGKNPEARGSLHPNIAPYGETFRCSDGRYLVLAVGTDKQFARLCESCGLESLAADPAYARNTDRVSNREQLYGLLSPWFERQTADEVSVNFQHAGIPCSVVRTVAEALSSPDAVRLLQENNGYQTVKTVVFGLEKSLSAH